MGLLRGLYHQRSMDETVFNAVKRLMGEHLGSRPVRMQSKGLEESAAADG